MDTPLTKDARGLVDGVVNYLRHEDRSKTVLPKVQAFLGKVTASAKKEKIAKVETSVSLTEDEETRIVKILTKLLGHEVQLESTVNPLIIAGLRIQVGDWIVDTTMRGQLEQLAFLLNQ